MKMDQMTADFSDEQKRYLEGFLSGVTAGRLGRWLDARLKSPGDVYDAMIVLFYVAAVLFTLSAIVRVASGR